MMPPYRKPPHPAHLGLTLPEIREATIQLDILTYLRWRQIPADPTHSARNHPETPGMADIIGCRTLIITPDMVGKRIAQFMAIEVKAEGGVVSEAQQRWLEQVHFSGGLVILAHCIEDVQRAIDGV